MSYIKKGNVLVIDGKCVALNYDGTECKNLLKTKGFHIFCSSHEKSQRIRYNKAIQPIVKQLRSKN